MHKLIGMSRTVVNTEALLFNRLRPVADLRAEGFTVAGRTDCETVLGEIVRDYASKGFEIAFSQRFGGVITYWKREIRKPVLIYKLRGAFPHIRAYLCADGSLTSERSQAAVHWSTQFDEIVRENWIVRPALMEPV